MGRSHTHTMSFGNGVDRAKSVISRSPDQVEYWLNRAERSRQRLATRLFLKDKREFLDGFIQRLRKFKEENTGSVADENVADDSVADENAAFSPVEADASDRTSTSTNAQNPPGVHPVKTVQARDEQDFSYRERMPDLAKLERLSLDSRKLRQARWGDSQRG